MNFSKLCERACPAIALQYALSLSALGGSAKAETTGRRWVRASGFTLIELLLVIVLMAIIIGISAPAFIGMGRGAGMRGSVRGVCSTLSLLRQWAITHREETTFYYFVGTDPGTATNASYYYATASGVLIEKTNELPMEVMFDSDNDGNGTDTITFKTDGGLSVGAGNTLKIIIADRKVSTVTKTISVNGLTGGIRVE